MNKGESLEKCWKTVVVYYMASSYASRAGSDYNLTSTYFSGTTSKTMHALFFLYAVCITWHVLVLYSLQELCLVHMGAEGMCHPVVS